jgi:hypothetical protein
VSFFVSNAIMLQSGSLQGEILFVRCHFSSKQFTALHRGVFCQFPCQCFYYCHSKGQLISKGLFGILNSPKKQTKFFFNFTMIPHVDLFSFVFWEKLKIPKIPKCTEIISY